MAGYQLVNRGSGVFLLEINNYIELEGTNSAESQRIFHGRGQAFPGFEGINID